MVDEAKGAPRASSPPEGPQTATISPATLAHQIGDLILDKKGLELVVIDVEKVTTLTDHIVIATATSSRQMRSMAKEIHELVKKSGKTILSEEGIEQGWWALLDYGDVIVHVMIEDARRYYDLERLWADGEIVRRGPDFGPDEAA